MRSLRRDLIVGTLAGMVSVLFAAEIALYFTVRSSLLNQFDESLEDKAELLATGVEIKGTELIFDIEDMEMDEFESPHGPGFLQLWRPDGGVLYKSPSLGAGGFESESATQEPEIRSLQLPNGTAVREIRFRIAPGVDEETEPSVDFRGQYVRLAMARATGPVTAVLRNLALFFACLGTASMAISGVVLWMVIQKALKPVDSLAQAIGGIHVDELNKKIAPEHVSIEVAPVVERLNELLGRLRTAFERERSFTSDVAHELRTPLAGLRSAMDVALTRTRTAGEQEETLRDCLQITMQMQVMVENLLMLARLDAGHVDVHRERITLPLLIENIAKPMLSSALARGVRLEWQTQPNAEVHTDLPLLSLAVRNVLDNAFAYVDDCGTITVESSVRDGQTIFRVTNSGSSVSQEAAKHVFERFWRADAARSKTGLHSGLGLSLVKRIVTVLGGLVEVQTSAGGDFTVDVSLPSSAPNEHG
jgi:two-component system heavy metal sensor histidine kinase CusS